MQQEKLGIRQIFITRETDVFDEYYKTTKGVSEVDKDIDRYEQIKKITLLSEKKQAA